MFAVFSIVQLAILEQDSLGRPEETIPFSDNNALRTIKMMNKNHQVVTRPQSRIRSTLLSYLVSFLHPWYKNYQGIENPFRNAVPIWGQTMYYMSALSSKRSSNPPTLLCRIEAEYIHSQNQQIQACLKRLAHHFTD